MIDERVYKLNNGEEKVLLANSVYDNKRYLLLSDGKTEKVELAYEENGSLIIINEEYPNYNKILEILYNKLNQIKI